MQTHSVIVEETTTFTISEVCNRCNIDHELLVQMLEHGLFDFNGRLEDSYPLDFKTLKKIESAFRLHRDLEINMPGIALILELRDELDQLRNELNILQRHFDKE